MNASLAMVPKLAKKARLVVDRHTGKSMILYPERGLELNESAAKIVGKCDGTRTIETICRELADEFDSTPQALIEDDVREVLFDLMQRGLIEHQ